MQSHDIVIVGGGMVGLTLACALAQKTTLSIALIEAATETPVWQPEQYYHRVSAFSISSRRLFESIDVWSAICRKRVSAFTGIDVWDDKTQAAISFQSRDISERELGYILENNLVQAALLEKIRTYPQIHLCSAVTLQACHQTPQAIELVATDGRVFRTAFAVAADGAQSWLRNKAGITLTKHDYEQQAIVATVKTTLPHHKHARQVFLETGPLAFLPLVEARLSSIVWSLPTDEAVRVTSLDDAVFKQELTHAFSGRLGEVVEVSTRFHFPLSTQQANSYLGTRVALVGDAAHTIHPLAGQGVNMGLLDAASLVDVMVDAIQKGRDVTSTATLRRYERWRKADNALMLTGVDVIKQLFASPYSTVQSFRSFGLSLTERTTWLKNIFTCHAVGSRLGLPSLCHD